MRLRRQRALWADTGRAGTHDPRDLGAKALVTSSHSLGLMMRFLRNSYFRIHTWYGLDEVPPKWTLKS